MKLCRLDLIAFGPFENVSLDLSRGEPGLHVIYGDNEDGKSTTLRAIRGLLFGIEERTTDDHVFKKTQLRVGGCLRRTDGSELAFVRRKGRKDTLRHPDSDEPLAENALEPFLGGLSEQVFSTLYGIDHQELVSGGKAILDQTGDLGKALYTAATGAASLQKVLDRMEQSADELFRPRASRSRIYAAVGEYTAKRKEAREATLLSSTWTKLRREHDEVSQEREDLEAERRGLERDLALRKRVRRVRPALARRKERQSALEKLGEVVDLPEDFEPIRHEAAELKRSTEERLEQVIDKAKRLALEESSAQLPTTLLEHAATIELLFRKLGSYEKAQKDRPTQDGKRGQHTNDARELLEAIRPDLDMNQVETMRPLLALKKSIQALATRHEQLAVEEQRAEIVLRKANDRVAAVQKKHEQADEARDPTRLTAAVNAAQRAGDLDTQVQDARARCDRKQEQCRMEIGRLGLWQGSKEELEHAPLPSADTIGIFETRFQEAADQARQHARSLQELEEQRHETEEKLAALAQGGPVPTTDELEASRAHRDQGWSLVRRQCFDHEDVDQEIQSFASQRALPEVYEDAVEAADEVADRLRSDADRVQQRESLEVELARVKRRLVALQASSEKVRQAQDTLQQEWQQVWVPVGIAPQSPREMASWLRKAETLRQHLEELGDHERKHEELTQRRIERHKALGKELEALGEDFGDGSSDLLNLLLERALSILESLNQRLAQKRELDRAVQKARADLSTEEQERKAIQDRRGLWEREWGETIQGFGFLGEPGAARVVATLEQLESLFRTVDTANGLQRRIDAIDRDITEYEAEVDRFGETVGRPRVDQPVDQYVAQLHDSLVKAREVETHLKAIRRQQEELSTEEAELRSKLRTAEGQFAELRTLACVEGDESLHESGQRAARARDFRSQVAELEQQILDAGDGHSIEQLRVQAEEFDSDELDEEVARFEEALEVVEQKHGDVFRHEVELNHQLESMSGAATAADATEQAEQLLSQMRVDVRTYLRLRAGHADFEEPDRELPTGEPGAGSDARQRVFSRGSRSVLSRAFGTSWTRNGRPILLGVRPDGPRGSRSTA